MALGDGAVVRAALELVVEFLRRFASPTGARGSILLMTGGLVVLGFLFLAFTFRSAIVGDLAPVANARAPLPRVNDPPTGTTAVARAAAPVADPEAFSDGRLLGRKLRRDLDEVIDGMASFGSEARILQSNATRKLIRVYRCASCAGGEGVHACERERGYFAGAFETLTGKLAKVEETACASRGASYCEFEVRHAVILRVVA